MPECVICYSEIEADQQSSDYTTHKGGRVFKVHSICKFRLAQQDLEYEAEELKKAKKAARKAKKTV